MVKGPSEFAGGTKWSFDLRVDFKGKYRSIVTTAKENPREHCKNNVP